MHQSIKNKRNNVHREKKKNTEKENTEKENTEKKKKGEEVTRFFLKKKLCLYIS